MAEGKWISDLTAATPLADAACRVLSVRLDTVRHYLPLALRQAEEDPEYVHQLRVSTRRAGAALEMFACCLPERVYRKARKMLRRIRRAAGEARDWDVFLLGLAEEKSKAHSQAVLDLLLGYGLARRILARDLLAGASPGYPFVFDRLLAETVAAVHKPRGHPELRTLLDLAQPMLARLLQELHQAATGDLTDYDHLHQVRIIGKRLRYAMEIFVDCFAPAFREQLYPAVEQMQEILGEANDSHVAGQRLALLAEGLRAYQPGDWRRFRTGLQRLQQAHQQRLAERRQQFVDWWNRWLQTGGENAFRTLLRKPFPDGEGRSVPDAKNGQMPLLPPG